MASVELAGGLRKSNVADIEANPQQRAFSYVDAERSARIEHIKSSGKHGVFLVFRGSTSENYIDLSDDDDGDDNVITDMASIYSSETMHVNNAPFEESHSESVDSRMSTASTYIVNPLLKSRPSSYRVEKPPEPPPNPTNGIPQSHHTSIATSVANPAKEPLMELDTPLVFFDSLVLEFNIRRFIEQLIIHLFHPLLIWAINPQAQSFCNAEPVDLYFSYFHPALVYLMIFTYALSPDEVITNDIIFPLSCYVMHKIVVSIKYACLSESEYERLQNAKPPHSDRYRRQSELISGWFERDPLVLDYEIGASIAKLGLKPTSKLRLKIGPHIRKENLLSMSSNLSLWTKYLTRNDAKKQLSPAEIMRNPELANVPIIQDKEGTYVSVFDLCAIIVKKSDMINFYFDFFDKGCLVLSVLNVFFSFVPLIQNGGRDNNGSAISGLTIVFYVCIIIIGFTYYSVVFEFMYIGAFDVTRQNELQKALQSMIDLSDLSKSIDVSYKLSAEQTSPQKDSKNFFDREILARLPRLRRRRKSSGSSSVSLKGPLSILQSEFNPSALNFSEFRSTYQESFVDVRPSISPPAVEAVNALERPSASEIGLNPIPELIVRSPASKGQTVDYHAAIPKLRLDSPENVIGWTYASLILFRFGARFRFRLQVYARMVVAIFIVLITISLIGATSADGIENVRRVFESAFFRQSFLAVTLIFIYVLILTFTSSLLNISPAKAVYLMSTHILRNDLKILDINEKVLNLDMELNKARSEESNGQDEVGAKIELIVSVKDKLVKYTNQLKAANNAIRECSEVLTRSSVNEPYTVMGIPATPALATSVVSGAFGFYVSLYKIYNPTSSVSVS